MLIRSMKRTDESDRTRSREEREILDAVAERKGEEHAELVLLQARRVGAI